MMDRFLLANYPRLVRLLLIVQVSGFAFFIAGTHGAFSPMPKPPTTTDFASFYAAGTLANEGRATLAYNAVAHRAAEAAATAPGVDEKRFLYPPVFLLICAPLARLPYLAAFVGFEVSTCLIWLWLMGRIAGGYMAGFAAIPAVWWALGWGQNSFVSASLMSAGTLFLRTRPWLAGAAFGALCFKPNFGLMIPVALVAGRQWRAIGGAALSACALCGMSALLFGPQTWRAFLAMAAQSRQAVETGINLAGHADLGGAARLAGMPAGASWVLQAGLSLAVALAVGWAWARTRREPLGAATVAAANAVLVAGTLASMPFVLFYDLVMAGVAAAWLVRAAHATGWRPGERTGLAAAFLCSLLAFPAAALAHVALGVLAAPILLNFGLARIRSPARTAG